MNAKIFRLFIALLISGASLANATPLHSDAQECRSTGVTTIVPARTNSLSCGKESGEGSPITSDLQSDASRGGDLKSPNDKPADYKSEGGLFCGIYLSGDVFGYLYPLFVKDKYYSSEFSVTMDIGNRFFPTVEAGVGHSDMVSQLYEIGYRTRAPYYRVGMDYNMQYESDKPGYIYLGGRVGYTSFDYSVNAPALNDPVWGDAVPMQFHDVPCRAVWVEVVGGVRAEIATNFYMGWSLRYRYPLHKGPISHGGPWYIPGFGASSGVALGATYNITYYLNFYKRHR